MRLGDRTSFCFFPKSSMKMYDITQNFWEKLATTKANAARNGNGQKSEKKTKLGYFTMDLGSHLDESEVQ